jgi:DNA-binding MarR family transcriptional regulator
MMPASALLPGLPGYAPPRTYAAWPIWSGSVREVKFTRMTKKQAARLYHQARAWNREKVAGRYGCMLGSSALRVLESLVFDFLNYASGCLDPSYDALARKLGLARSTVATALARLEELGIVNWLRRCTEDMDSSGRFILRQDTNAYAVLPPSQWHGYVPQEPPPPHPAEWGGRSSPAPDPRAGARSGRSRQSRRDAGDG